MFDAAKQVKGAPAMSYDRQSIDQKVVNTSAIRGEFKIQLRRELAFHKQMEIAAGEPVAFSMYKNRTERCVGVFVGDTGLKLNDGIVYESHFIASGVFPEQKKSSRSSSSSAQSMQDRQGLHTFRRGDLVELQPPKPPSPLPPPPPPPSAEGRAGGGGGGGGG